MTPVYEQFAQHYTRLGKDPEHVLAWHCKMGGLAWVEHDRIFMCRPIHTERPHVVIPADMGLEAANCWWVQANFGKGAMRMAFERAPYALPLVGWARSQRGGDVMYCEWERLKRKIERFT